MAPKWKKKTTILPLDDCIKNLEALPSFYALDPKEAGELYVSSIAFLQHLSVDQDAISTFRKRHNKISQAAAAPPFPKPSEIPAMTAVVHTQTFFQALVSCLKSTTECPDPANASLASHNTLYATGARKRNHSIDLFNTAMDGSTPKNAKLALGQSPYGGKRIVNPVTNSTQPKHQQSQQPQMNIRVIAATILYVAFEPLDHWPVPLLEAYAEDSFGARLWVDDPACQPLVHNLELAHMETGETDSNGSPYGEGVEAEALMVAKFYDISNEMGKNSPPTTIPIVTEEAMRRGSLTSTASRDVVTLAPRGRSTSFGSVSGMFQPGSSTSTSPTLNRPTKKASNGGGSVSGEDAEVALATSSNKNSNDSDGSSSSSGEDEEVFMEEMSVDGSDIVGGDVSPNVSTSEPPPPSFKLTYPTRPSYLKYAQVRQRFFGLNLQYAHLAISSKLTDRLEIKSKQNSGLLQCLPSFTAIPNVRSLVTENLEKWLQSPALSGLARNLFSATVNAMKNADPPLREDLDALDNILSMRLKANQLNCHIENLTAVAKAIPTVAVANHIYSHLLREILLSLDTATASFSEHVSMIHAVHGTLPRELQAIGIASSLVGMLIQPPRATDIPAKPELVKRILALIRTIHKKFGHSLNSLEVMKEILSIQVDSDCSWTVEDEENKARLLFQLATLLVDPSEAKNPANNDGNSAKGSKQREDKSRKIRERIIESRKLMLRWFCNDYAPMFPTSSQHMNGHHETYHPNGKENEIAGAGPTNYKSVLDGLNEEATPHWQNVMRCVLFMETSDSVILRHFLSPDGISVESDSDWHDFAKRIDLCCDLGADLDDDTVLVVLGNATKGEKSMARDTALVVLEHLFHCCRIGRKPRLCLEDPGILWKLYELAEYLPPKKIGDTLSDGPMKMVQCEINARDVTEDRSITRLAYAGLWWRVTVIALIICGAAPEKVGSVAWEQHPTLAALIKMVTSDRYRFPTVDCDDAAREEQKRIEQTMRDEEARITEQLFLPPKKKRKKQNIAVEVSHQGSRASRRQQEKREKMWEKLLEKEKAEERAEANRRKKLLRAAQKSITLLDPRRGPRKPPRESADLIFSVGELFDLPRVFQSNIKPDFVLGTIGSTSRNAIERAYDWLIPIISYLPQTISRLPASASCFLLLRAYGTQGEERSELQTLSAPLLQHVHDSLIGKFGEVDAVRAFELLFSDLASHKPDRRRCARRVLQNAVGKETDANDAPFSGSNHSWVSSLTQVKNANSILVEAVNKFTTAATYERGSNLRYLVLALHKLTTFAKCKKIAGKWDFGTVLMNLMSRRPAVFASALICFTNLCSLVVKTIFEEYKMEILGPNSREGSGGHGETEFTLCSNPFGSNDGDRAKARVPLDLLKSSCVILSVWMTGDSNSEDAKMINGLANMLLLSLDACTISDDGSAKVLSGLASAKSVDTEETIVPVEFWVMLAKSRSDTIAKRAALSAPTVFLPRLLLCSGLPRASLLTMVDRLGKLGEKATDIEKEFNQLLVPSATSEWDIARLGNRREMHRRLHGRISAYLRKYNFVVAESTESISFVFYQWLSKSCEQVKKSVKPKTKKPKVSTAPLLENIKSVPGLLSLLPQTLLHTVKNEVPMVLDGDTSGMTAFLASKSADNVEFPERLDDIDAIKTFLKHVFEETKPTLLDDWLTLNFGSFTAVRKRNKRRQKLCYSPQPKLEQSELAALLLECYSQLEQKVEEIASTVVSWVPRLSFASGTPRLWILLFSQGQKPSFLWNNLLSRCLQAWDHNHITSCRAWLFSAGKDVSLDLAKVVRFLVGASSFCGVHFESFVDSPVSPADSAWARCEETVSIATHFSIECLVGSNSDQRLRSRNDLPDCLVLLVLIARVGRKQLHFISEALVKRLPDQSNVAQKSLLLALLRLYAYFPFSMNLGVAAHRSNLTKAVELCADDWLCWRSPFDDSLQDMLGCAFSHNIMEQSGRSLVDTAKKHPLLLLRKIDRITIALETDAMASEKASNEKVGFISSCALEGPIEARVNDITMLVQVKHWGYNYTEPSWFLILDVISAVPQEVLFGCAIKMGLTNVFDLYLRLIYIQSQLNAGERLSVLKEKFSGLLSNFKSSKCPRWESWLASPMPQFPTSGAIRNTLMSCGLISQEEALESVKKAHT
ncbi:DUF3677 domain containing protein [Nitzschia inconspicua]|uniref:DUF3677 domain containing protein n=1 Tax=Nitzschia inconspicua TaxID=303405 RepID=A0A9K3KQ70_9STRA|nr:DUF3677 domain containing protein [Nitzschia inconspicua]